MNERRLRRCGLAGQSVGSIASHLGVQIPPHQRGIQKESQTQRQRYGAESYGGPGVWFDRTSDQCKGSHVAQGASDEQDS